MGLDLVIHTYRKQQSTAPGLATSHIGQMRTTTYVIVIKKRTCQFQNVGSFEWDRCLFWGLYPRDTII